MYDVLSIIGYVVFLMGYRWFGPGVNGGHYHNINNVHFSDYLNPDTSNIPINKLDECGRLHDFRLLTINHISLSNTLDVYIDKLKVMDPDYHSFVMKSQSLSMVAAADMEYLHFIDLVSSQSGWSEYILNKISKVAIYHIGTRRKYTFVASELEQLKGITNFKVPVLEFIDMDSYIVVGSMLSSELKQ
jgi:hypothetical protein